jgi:hypothetical protein
MIGMTSKTQSQRTGTGSPSDLPSEASADSTIGGIHRPGSVHLKAPVRSDSRVCAHCGVEIGVRNEGPMRAPKLILNCLSCVLLIAVVLCVGYLLNSWAERGFDNLFDHWVWHEPLDDWSK